MFKCFFKCARIAFRPFVPVFAVVHMQVVQRNPASLKSDLVMRKPNDLASRITCSSMKSVPFARVLFASPSPTSPSTSDRFFFFLRRFFANCNLVLDRFSHAR